MVRQRCYKQIAEGFMCNCAWTHNVTLPEMPMLRRSLFVAIGLSMVVGIGGVADAVTLPASGTGAVRIWVANEVSGTVLPIDGGLTSMLGVHR